jgi:hypothetical protein
MRCAVARRDSEDTSSGLWAALFAATIFLSAFLLFEVQPIAGKMVLPWFGGGSTVWITTLMFFQVTLLVGYAYSHFVALRLGPRAQGLVHAGLVLAALLSLPILPSASWKPTSEDQPALRLVLLLAVTVGPTYLLLSTTGPLLQHWFARRFPTRSPYPLYALSNVGSLLALLSYPPVIERFLGLHAQAWSFSGGYAVFAAACCALALVGARAAASRASAMREVSTARPAEQLGGARLALWVLLPACASALLLAVTNNLTEDVGGLPLLWVLPLAVYLVTFILCFSSEKMYEPNLYTVTLGLACFGGWYALRELPITLQAPLYLLVLFLVCMSLHGETALLRPSPRHLTLFYFLVSVGGALGGLFAALAAPVLFKGFWEYHVALFVAPVLVLLSRLREERSRRSMFTLASVGAISAVLVATLGVALWRDTQKLYANALVLDRSFYGVVRVYDTKGEPPRHDMQHGRILHGFQYQLESLRSEPSGYYGPYTAAGLALLEDPHRGERPLKVGVIGLGAGMLGAYVRPGDDWTFYEINPQVVEVAEHEFSYLGDARQRGGSVRVVLGDARTGLERELAGAGSQQYDVLILDAFTSDAIPVHLLTREAVRTYWQHLRADGVLAVHISNAFVDLSPVVRGFAADSGYEARLTTGSGATVGALQSYWVAVTSNRAFLDAPEVAGHLAPWPEGGRAPVVWTDDYSNLYSLLTLR